MPKDKKIPIPKEGLFRRFLGLFFRNAGLSSSSRASASRRALVRGAATVFDISGTGVVRYGPEEYQTWFSRDVNALNRDWDVIQQEYGDVLKR